MKKILVIKAHPREASFCNALVEKYIEGAKANKAEVNILDLRDLGLEPCLKYDWSHNHDSMPPALLTLFIEMVIVSRFAFKYHKPLFGVIPRWDRLLKGRTAALISTMDAPPIFMKFHDLDPGGKMMKDVTRFTGVKLIGKHYFGSVILSSAKKKEAWLARAYEIGRKESR